MSKLVRITETADAITAEAAANVWEEYAAPRKRVPRARIIEYHFTVSIPKHAEEAAPVAFIIQREGQESQPIRYAAGQFYHRATFANPAEAFSRALENAGIPEYTAEEYADRIARDEVRADQWHQYANETAEYVETETARHLAALAIISGEVWQTCKEPAYEYNRPSTWRGTEYPAYVSAITSSYSDNPGRIIYGAADQVVIILHHGPVEYLDRIEVIRPDLVTLDSTARDLESDRDRAQWSANRTAEKIEELERHLEEAREELAKHQADAAAAAEKLEEYNADPKKYLLALCERLETSDHASGSLKSRAAAARRALEETGNTQVNA